MSSSSCHRLKLLHALHLKAFINVKTPNIMICFLLNSELQNATCILPFHSLLSSCDTIVSRPFYHRLFRVSISEIIVSVTRVITTPLFFSWKCLGKSLPRNGAVGRREIHSRLRPISASPLHANKRRSHQMTANSAQIFRIAEITRWWSSGFSWQNFSHQMWWLFQGTSHF